MASVRCVCHIAANATKVYLQHILYLLGTNVLTYKFVFLRGYIDILRTDLGTYRGTPQCIVRYHPITYKGAKRPVYYALLTHKPKTIHLMQSRNGSAPMLCCNYEEVRMFCIRDSSQLCQQTLSSLSNVIQRQVFFLMSSKRTIYTS